MQKIKLLFVLLWAINISVSACDLGHSFMNIMPNDYQNSFGFRYRQSLYNKIINGSKSAIQFTPYQYTGLRTQHNLADNTQSNNVPFLYQEKYTTLEFFGNWYLSKKWQLFAMLSMSDNYITYDDSTVVNVSGLGDATLLLQYQLFSTKQLNDSAKIKFSHRLIIGQGMVLPIGNYQKQTVFGYKTELLPGGILTVPLTVVDAEMQPGRGSFSSVSRLNYFVKYKKVAVNTAVSLVVNSENSLGYKFANQIMFIQQYMYFITMSKYSTISPIISLNYETAGYNTYKKERVSGTGGETLLLMEGLRFINRYFSATFNYGNILYQKLWDNQPLNKYRYNLSIRWYINKRKK